MGQDCKLERGYVQVYTGDGKGKTTSALGLALRAAGRGMRTYIAQFMKGQQYGELDTAARLGGTSLIIEQFGRDTFVHVTTRTPEDERMARSGLEAARTAMLSGAFDIVVLDEAPVAVHFGLLTDDDLLRFIDEKPERVELVITGRRASAALIERADLVTEMREVKHYYASGVEARDGIER